MVDRLSYFLFHPVLHDWYSKDHGMCYPVFGMVHIKELFGADQNWFPLSHYLSGPLQYV